MADHAHNLRADAVAGRSLGVITRGTTNHNRLRRCDRWMASHPGSSSLLRTTDAPSALDVGYGASFATSVEWARWLRTVNPHVRVTGLEINPERVLPPRGGVNFELGGFELRNYRPQLVRAFIVLRRYEVEQVHVAWGSVTYRLATGRFLVVIDGVHV